MPGFGLLVDDFNDNVRDPVVWSQSYGDPVEAGGRARIPCTTGYAAYRSASTYTLAWSQVAARIYPPAVGGASTAVVSFLVLTDTGGTDAGFLIDVAQNAMGLYSRVGYADGGALFPAYDPVAHAFLRLREDGGTLRWETSPDGAAWTVRRTAAAPAWVSQSNLSLLIEAHRDSGTGDFAEADQLNTGRPGGLADAARTGAGLSGLARSASTLSGG